MKTPQIDQNENIRIFHSDFINSFLARSDSRDNGDAGNSVHQRVQRRDARPAALRPVSPQIRCLLPAGRHGEQRQIRHQVCVFLVD